MAYVIGVDAGGTKTKAIAYSDSGIVLHQTITGHGNLSVDYEGGLANIETSIIQVTKALPNDTLHKLVIGIAGLPLDQSFKIEEHFKSKYNTQTDVMTDYELAYKATFSNQDGILVIAGTGSLLYGENNGIPHKLSGWGHLLGDQVSGYGLVVLALQKIISIYEKTNHISPLIRLVPGASQDSHIDVIKSFVYGSPKDDIAAQAPVVLELAESGNEDAITVVNQLASELMSYIKLLTEKMDSEERPHVALMGGLLHKGNYFYRKVINELKSLESINDILGPAEPCEAALSNYSKIKDKKISKRFE